MPWLSLVPAVHSLPHTITVISACCRPFTTCHGNYQHLLQTFCYMPWPHTMIVTGVCYTSITF
jgi:hypothetical protein